MDLSKNTTLYIKIISIAFACGIFYNKLDTMDTRLSRLENKFDSWSQTHMSVAVVGSAGDTSIIP